MAEFRKGEGYGSMYVGDGKSCDPSNPNTGNMSKLTTSTHDKLDKHNKVIGTDGAKDLRGGAYKGKTQQGPVINIPSHYQTQNGKDIPDKRAKVTGSK